MLPEQVLYLTLKDLNYPYLEKRFHGYKNIVDIKTLNLFQFVPDTQRIYDGVGASD